MDLEIKDKVKVDWPGWENIICTLYETAGDDSYYVVSEAKPGKLIKVPKDKIIKVDEQNKKAEEFKDEPIPTEEPGVQEDLLKAENEELRKDIRELLDFIFNNALITELDIPDKINEIDNKYFK